MRCSSRQTQYRLVVMGFIPLLLGVLVYLLLYAEKFNMGIKFDIPSPLLQNIVHSLPSFLHVIAFTLLTLATYTKHPRGLIISWSLIWGAVNGICEWLQHYSDNGLPLRESLPDGIVDYFESGTFDSLDMAAIGLATLILILLTPLIRSEP